MMIHVYANVGEEIYYLKATLGEIEITHSKILKIEYLGDDSSTMYVLRNNVYVEGECFRADEEGDPPMAFTNEADALKGKAVWDKIYQKKKDDKKKANA